MLTLVSPVVHNMNFMLSEATDWLSLYGFLYGLLWRRSKQLFRFSISTPHFDGTRYSPERCYISAWKRYFTDGEHSQYLHRLKFHRAVDWAMLRLVHKYIGPIGMVPIGTIMSSAACLNGMQTAESLFWASLNCGTVRRARSRSARSGAF